MIEKLKRLALPMKVGFGAAFLVAVVSLFLPNYYRSYARILPIETKGISGGLGNFSTVAAAFGVSVPGGEGSDANFVDILQSRWLAERLLETNFTFKYRSWRFGAEHEKVCTLYDFIHKKNIDRALVVLGKSLAVSRDLKTKVITISAETKSPALSQALVQKTTQLLETYVEQKGRTRGGAKATFVTARLLEARAEMGRAEDNLRIFLEQNRNFATSLDPNIRLKGLALEAELKLHQQVVTSLALSREQALMEEKNDIPIVNLMDSGNLPVEKSRPVRSGYVLFAFFLTFFAAWGWAEREMILALLRAD